MPYTLSQLQAMEARELIDIAEHDVCEFSTTDTERALIYQLNDLLNINDDLLCPSDVEDVLNEVSAQLPQDDFLGHAIDIADSIAKGNTLKSAMISEALRLSEMLHTIQDEQRNATDYACHEILKLTQPETQKG